MVRKTVEEIQLEAAAASAADVDTVYNDAWQLGSVGAGPSFVSV